MKTATNHMNILLDFIRDTWSIIKDAIKEFFGPARALTREDVYMPPKDRAPYDDNMKFVREDSEWKIEMPDTPAVETKIIWKTTHKPLATRKRHDTRKFSQENHDYICLQYREFLAWNQANPHHRYTLSHFADEMNKALGYDKSPAAYRRIYTNQIRREDLKPQIDINP